MIRRTDQGHDSQTQAGKQDGSPWYLLQLGDPVYRDGVITDNGNIILDIYNFAIPQPLGTEEKINGITGVVTNGLFALKPADILLLATPSGVKTLRPK